jgi:heterodisulfide reductase subunit B
MMLRDPRLTFSPDACKDFSKKYGVPVISNNGANAIDYGMNVDNLLFNSNYSGRPT